MKFRVDYHPSRVADHGSVMHPEQWSVTRVFDNGETEHMRFFTSEDDAHRTAEFHNQMHTS